MIVKQAKSPLRVWKIVSSSLPELVGKTIAANTKGEARSALKEYLGLAKLPSGIVLEKVNP